MRANFTIAAFGALLAAGPALAQAPTGRVTPQYPRTPSMGAPSLGGQSQLPRPAGRETPGSEGTTSGSTAPPGTVRPPPMSPTSLPPIDPALPAGEPAPSTTGASSP